MTPEEAGQAFIAEIIAKLPTGAQESVRTALAESPEAIALVGNGALRQQEFSRTMDVLRKTEADQRAWFDVNKPLLEVGQKAKAAGFDPATGTLKKPGTDSPGLQTVALPDDVIRRSDMNAREEQYAAFSALVPSLAIQHFATFNEVLKPADWMGLMQDAGKKNVSLQAAYDEKFGDKYALRAKTAEDARIEAIVKDRLAAERKVHPSYPGSGKLEPGSPLDVLEQKPGAQAGPPVDELVDAYYALAGTT